MKRISGLVLFCFYFLSASLGLAEVKPKMDQMLTQIFSLKPYIISPTDFADPKNSVEINNTLKKMVEISRSISHEDMVKKGTFQVPAKILQQQLTEAEVIFRTGNKDYALWLIRTTLSNCMACHTQLPATSTHFESMNKDHFLANSFDEAEFLYIVRNFDKAMELYEKTIAEFPKNKINASTLEIALFRKIYYFVRVKRDFKALTKSLQKDQSNKKLTSYVKKLIADYKKASEKMQDQSFPEYKAGQEDLLKAQAENLLKEEMQGRFATDNAEKNLQNLRLSSALYEFLSKNPETSLKPYIYYWLSFCENRWQGFAFDSLPEQYLKKCILESPASPIAPACLKEYKDLVTMAFTGSSGTNIPGDIQKEMKTFQDLIEKMKPSSK